MKKWSLNSKLYLVISIFALSNIFAVALGLFKLSSLNQSMDDVTGVLSKRTHLLNEFKLNQSVLAIKIRDIFLEESNEEIEKTAVNMRDEKKNLDESLDAFQALAPEEERAIAKKMKEHLAVWWSGIEISIKMSQDKKSKEAYQFAITKLVPIRNSISEDLEALIAKNERAISDAKSEVTSDYSNSRNQMLLVCSLSLLFGCVFSFYILLNFNKAIKNVIASLNQSSENVATASLGIAGSAQGLSEATTEQAASLQQTAASLEQITAMIAKATDSAASTATSSEESQKHAEHGRSAVDQMVTSMDEIGQSNDAIMNQITASNQQMSEIVKVIQEIGSKTKVINEIVFQTKLLSFNASVEAARAGEHGKGFAVVAEEVGNLAQMSGNAAKEISDLLETSTSRVEKIVEETKGRVNSLSEQGKIKVESGIAVSKLCSEALGQIVQNVAKVSILSQEISQASKEQTQGVGEINKAMGQLDSVTQQNAATSEKAATEADKLSAQAKVLRDSVHELVVTVQGHKTLSQEVSKSVVKKPKEKEAKVLSLKTKPKKISTEENKPKFKKAVGHGSVPSRDDDGFKDI